MPCTSRPPCALVCIPTSIDQVLGDCFCPNCVQCDDGNPCTIDEFDENKNKCTYKPKNCSDGDECTNDQCDATSGKCVHTKITNCNEPPPSGCTRTRGYWSTHHALGKNKKQKAPWPATNPVGPIQPDLDESGKGRTEHHTFTDCPNKIWYDYMIEKGENGNAWKILVKQWIAAYLNSLAGASVNSDVQNALTLGRELLEANNCDGYVNPPANGSLRDLMLETKDTLDAFNNGNNGPPHCS